MWPEWPHFLIKLFLSSCNFFPVSFVPSPSSLPRSFVRSLLVGRYLFRSFICSLAGPRSTGAYTAERCPNINTYAFPLAFEQQNAFECGTTYGQIERLSVCIAAFYFMDGKMKAASAPKIDALKSTKQKSCWNSSAFQIHPLPSDSCPCPCSCPASVPTQ